jgi:hypothetical protein
MSRFFILSLPAPEKAVTIAHHQNTPQEIRV